jgi:hypothetical protein
MKKILIYTAPFSYGPAGKALALASHLQKFYEVKLIGCDTGWNLIALDLEARLAFNTPKASNELSDDVLINYDLVISCSDLKFASRVHQLGIKSVMFDSVFWWRHPPSDAILSVDAYIIQDFFGVDEAVASLKQLPPNLYKVGAVLRDKIDRFKPTSEREEKIVVSYGGIESPYIYVPKNSQYPFFMTRALLPLFQSKPDVQFIVTGKEQIIKEIAKDYFGVKNVAFKALRHEEFLSCLASSRLALITPGIETIYESIYLHTSSVMLLPQNSTQYLQLLALIDFGLESHVCHYKFYGVPCDYKRDEDEKKEIASVIKIMNYFFNSQTMLESYTQNLYSLIEKRLEFIDMYEFKKRSYMSSFNFKGAESVVEIVKNLIGL